ncbi:polysaccharide biosynthesis protein [Nocardioides sp. SYSU D00038]|uniref:lipopolysaccharide biosynthesis protein n=1 Tax=Nocardioides sp. SYSU D00038 TaxID=2812554 RepID=UPI0027DD132E|nr:polysaccharide biosynthesis protein [Nocardioides sp. SYSU D00038]
MTTTTRPERAPASERLRALIGSGAGIAVAIVTMNVATYGFQMIAARLLGPEQYGGVASLMALLLVVAVVQLGLQATAARRIAATPDHVAQIERSILRVTYRAALAMGLLLLLLAPLVWQLLKLDSIVPALLVAVAAVPLTVMGGQAGILQGERRWLALGLVYLAAGLPRLVLGWAAISVRPTEGAAMAAVALGMWAPVAVGWWALRHGRHPGEDVATNAARPTAREALRASVALLAFFVLSNADIVIARQVLDGHDAGLYAGGLILTKAVLFLPQFVVVVAFPAMSTVAERRRALLRSLAAVLALGVVATAGAVLLSGVAMVFVGGEKYGEVESRLWQFAVLGTFLAILQLLVYSVLARQGSRSVNLVWAAVVALVAGGVFVDSLDGLLLLVLLVDGALFVLLLSFSLWRLKEPVPSDPAAAPDTTPAPAP